MFASQVQELEVSLPWHLVGSVPITNYSAVYTTRLMDTADTTEARIRIRMIRLNIFYSEGDM